MQPAVATILSSLDRIFSKDDATAADVWDVLAAIRGPDGDGDKNVTEIIRAAAFPRTADLYWSFASPARGMIPATLARRGTPLPRISDAQADTHFYRHILRAARVLDLIGPSASAITAPPPAPVASTLISNIQS